MTISHSESWTGGVKNEKEKEFKVEKVHNYNEAIDIAGNGWYPISLMIVLSLTLLFMCVDLFSFSVVVSLTSCDFQLTMGQKGFLISIPFLGPVLMAYTWGYISDTRGRRWSLLLAMSVSFVMSTLCAFAPNWIVLAVFKLIGTCFVSCAQSASCTLLGESCPERVKGTYLLIMTSLVHLGSSIYFVVGYFVSQLDFSYDLVFISFVPWRLLTLLLALPLGLSALALCCFHESPKFLINVGREEEAVYVLSKIYERNGNKRDAYPVKRVILNEEGNVSNKNTPLLQSLRDQTIPLFKPPLVWNTMLLYYLTFIIYSTNSGFYTWLPFISKAFTSSASNSSEAQGICEIISSSPSNTTASASSVSCKTTIELPIVIAAVVYGSVATIINICLSRLASRKKLLMTIVISTSCFSCFITQVGSSTNFFYFAILTSSITLGPLSSYYVDLYPTSFRGMAGCLGVMVGRLSGAIGINVMGSFIMTQCTTTFYGSGAIILSGVVMSLLLPSDKKKPK